MKKFRLLAVMALAVVMLFTVAAAASVEYNGTDDTITVNLMAPGTYKIDQASSIFMSYDSSIFSVASMASPVYAAATLKDEGNAVSWCCDNAAVDVVKDESVILSVVFNVVNKNAAVGYKFDTASDLTAVFTDAGDYLMDMGSVTVEAAAASEPTVVTGIAATNAEYKVVQGAENSYWGVWVGTYTVNAGGKALVKAKVDFAAADKSFETDALNVEGSGDVVFDIAIIGVPTEYQNEGIATATLQ